MNYIGIMYYYFFILLMGVIYCVFCAAMLAVIVASYKQFTQINYGFITQKRGVFSEMRIIRFDNDFGYSMQFRKFGDLVVKSFSSTMYPRSIGVIIGKFYQDVGAYGFITVSSKCYNHFVSILPNHGLVKLIGH